MQLILTELENKGEIQSIEFEIPENKDFIDFIYFYDKPNNHISNDNDNNNNNVKKQTLNVKVKINENFANKPKSYHTPENDKQQNKLGFVFCMCCDFA